MLIVKIVTRLVTSNYIFSVVPVIKDKPKIIKIIKKRTVVIECVVASKFEPKCTWYKESNTVKESNRHVYQVEKTKEGEFAVKLEINAVEDSDKGAYKLVASNEKGEAVSQVVNLVDIPEEERKPCKPEIARKLVDQKITESKTFELIISLKQSDRKCKVEWYKSSTLIRETKDITTTFDGTTARLTFSSAKAEHTSNYKVIVTNEVGKDESTCKITVEKKDKKKDEKAEKDKEEAEKKRKVIEKTLAKEVHEEQNNILAEQHQQVEKSLKIQKAQIDKQEINISSHEQEQQSIVIVQNSRQQQQYVNELQVSFNSEAQEQSSQKFQAKLTSSTSVLQATVSASTHSL